MYIILGILAFGLIIVVHELGHFLTAKAFNVKVIELAIGMGPKILSKKGKETLYSLRAIPVGGFCSMEGEYGERIEHGDDDRNNDKPAAGDDIAFTDYVLADGAGVDNEEFTRAKPDRFEPKRTPVDDDGIELDPRAFMAQKPWKRVVILAAGSITNLLFAFIIIIIMSMGEVAFGSTEIAYVKDNMPHLGESEIKSGDKILAVNSGRTYYHNDYAMFMMINENKPITLTLLRDGEKIEYHRKAYQTDDGEDMYRYGISFKIIEPNFVERLKFSCYWTYNFVRMIPMSISMMISGSASVRDVAGPVGILSAMNDVGQEAESVGEGIGNIIYFMAFIGVNVAVINLLPIPAMDGGRILFTFITFIIEKVTRRRLDPKYENYINTGAFILLIGLMILIFYNDVMRLING